MRSVWDWAGEWSKSLRSACLPTTLRRSWNKPKSSLKCWLIPNSSFCSKIMWSARQNKTEMRRTTSSLKCTTSPLPSSRSIWTTILCRSWKVSALMLGSQTQGQAMLGSRTSEVHAIWTRCCRFSTLLGPSGIRLWNANPIRLLWWNLKICLRHCSTLRGWTMLLRNFWHHSCHPSMPAFNKIPLSSWISSLIS